MVFKQHRPLKSLASELKEIGPAVLPLIYAWFAFAVISDPIYNNSLWFHHLPQAVSQSDLVKFFLSHWSNLAMCAFLTIGTYYAIYSPLFAIAGVTFLVWSDLHYPREFLFFSRQPAINFYLLFTALGVISRRRLHGSWPITAACISLVMNGLMEFVPGAYSNWLDPMDFAFGALGIGGALYYLVLIEEAYPRDLNST